MIRVRHLYISPGHNYFGHHGQPAGEHPLLEVEAVECVAGRGIAGDRFFDFKENYKGQVTFFAWETIEAFRREMALPEASPAATRRNVITEGTDLPGLVGTRFEIQGVAFEGVEECKPCHWMNGALGPGAEQWLKGQGGLRARILTSGWLHREKEPSSP